jgi:hypothetical protein
VRDRFIAGQPAEIRNFLDDHHRELDRKFRNKPYPWTAMPSWRLVPSMLAQAFRRDGAPGRLPSGFLRDVRWGQYCLYLCIRFQDDLYDGESDARVAILAADQCLAEAARVFAGYLPVHAWFWRVFRESFSITTRSIAEVAEMQRRPRTSPDLLLDGYARESEVLKVGSAAVCALRGREKVFPGVSAFCDEMAKAGQILDDLQDVGEDLARGRHNYVAGLFPELDRRSGGSPRDPVLEALGSLAVRHQAIDRIRHHVQRAALAVEPLSLPGMPKYISTYITSLAELEQGRRSVQESRRRARTSVVHSTP